MLKTVLLFIVASSCINASTLTCVNACPGLTGATGGGRVYINAHYWAMADPSHPKRTCTSTGRGNDFLAGLCGEVGRDRPEKPGNWFNPFEEGLAGNCRGLNGQLSLWTSGANTMHLRTADGYQTSCKTGNLNQGATQTAKTVRSCDIPLGI